MKNRTLFYWSEALWSGRSCCFLIRRVALVSTLVAKITPEFLVAKVCKWQTLFAKICIIIFESRCFGRANFAAVAKVATGHHGRESLEMPIYGRESLDMPNFGLESLKVPKTCRENLDMSLGSRPGWLLLMI